MPTPNESISLQNITGKTSEPDNKNHPNPTGMGGHKVFFSNLYRHPERSEGSNM
jgi:hypothetical protein